MSMITLRRFVGAGMDLETALRRVPVLLVEALALQAVEFDPLEREEFQLGLRKLGSDLQEATDAQTVLVATGEIIKTLDSYHRALERFSRNRVRELNGIVGLLADKLAGMADGSADSFATLRSMANSLHTASQIDDLRAIRSKLEESLSGIRPQAAYHAAELRDIPEEGPGDRNLADGTAAGADPSAIGVDTVTGLPNQAAAEVLLRNALSGDTLHTFAVIFRVERMAIINQRFGLAAGDSILMLYAQQIAQRLAPQDQLFSWRGASLLALIARPDSTLAVGLEMRRVGAARFEHNASINGKAVSIPVSAAFRVLKLQPHQKVEELAKILDKFAIEQVPVRNQEEN
jgi:GGDEF domain-containing protein